jgi:hypothetical protein
MSTLAAIGGFLLTYGGTIISVAALAYSIFFAPDAPSTNQRTEGARIGDLTVTTSTYGKDIPSAWGTMRYGGNIIWARPIEERKKKTRKRYGGGKGGGGGSTRITHTSYHYYGHFAIQFSEGEAAENGLIRVWADGKLVWDRRPGKQMSKKYDEMDIRFYRGTKTQLPDAYIESYEGVGNVPGHRDTVYIVVQDMPLGDAGNRPPNFTAEISYNATGVFPTTDLTTYADAMEGMVWDPLDEMVFFHDKQHPTGGVLSIDLKDDSLQRTRAITDLQVAPPASWELNSGCSVNPDGYPIYKVNDVGPPNNDRAFALDAYNLETVDVTDGGQPAGAPDLSWEDATQVDKLHNLGMGRYVIGASTNGIQMLNLGSDYNTNVNLGYQDWIYAGGVANNAALACVADKNGTVWCIGYNKSPSAASAFLWQTEIAFEVANVGYIYIAEEHDISAYMHEPHLLCYDYATHSLLIGSRFNSWSRDYTIIRWDIDSESVLWQITPADVTTGNLTSDEAKFFFKFGPDGQYLYSYDGPGNILYQVRISDGEVTREWDLDDFGVAANLWPAFHHRTTHSVIGHDRGGGGSTKIMRLWLDRASVEPVPLDEVLLDLSTRTGLETSDIDVSSITAAGTEVRGYLRSKQSTVRAAIEPLGFAYFFDAVESDNKVKYVKRGGSVVATVEEDDLGAAASGSRASAAQRLVQEVAMEAEIPRRVELRFRDVEKDYDQGMEYATRTANPVGYETQGSDDTQSVEVAMALTPSEALSIVESALYQIWTNRKAFEFQTMPKHQLLEPTDIINVNHKTNTYRLKLIQSGLGAGFLCDLAGATDDAETYTFSDLSTDGGAGHHDQSMYLAGRSKLFLYDVPLLRDTDDPGTLSGVLYIAVGSTTTNWRGSLVYKSLDGNSFDQVDVPAFEAAWGTTMAKPGGGAFDNALDPYMRWTTWDRESSLRVRMVTGADQLISVTELACLNGESAAMVGNEIIKFQSVSGPDADGIYTLTNLIRGRRGTQQYAEEGHARAEEFVLLNPSSLSLTGIRLEDIGVAWYYRAVSVGARLEDASMSTLVYTAACLKPYSVSHLEGARDGSDNIDLVWIRRTRLGGFLDWNDGITEVLLAEDEEKYEVDYYSPQSSGTTDGAGGTVDTLKATAAFTGIAEDDLVGASVATEVNAGQNLQQSVVTARVSNDVVSVDPPWEVIPNSVPYAVASLTPERTEEETSEAGQYSAAEQGTDGLSPPVEIYAVVYQISAVVGRGFSNDVWVF